MAAETGQAASLTLRLGGQALRVEPEHIDTMWFSTPHDIHESGDDGHGNLVRRIGRGHIIITIDLADDVVVGELWADL